MHAYLHTYIHTYMRTYIDTFDHRVKHVRGGPRGFSVAEMLIVAGWELRAKRFDRFEPQQWLETKLVRTERI